MLQEKKKPHKILDVRELAEYEAGHVEGSLHVPHNELEENIESLIPEKGHTIVVIIGEEEWHAKEVWEHLQAKGYADVRFLLGGFDEWCKPAQIDVSDVVEEEDRNLKEDKDDLIDETGDIDQEDEKYDPLY